MAYCLRSWKRRSVPLTREHLLQATRVHEDIFDRSIDVQVLRLRRKLETDPSRAARDPDRTRRRLHLCAGGRTVLNGLAPTVCDGQRGRRADVKAPIHIRVIALARWPAGLTFSGDHGRPENTAGSKLPL